MGVSRKVIGAYDSGMGMLCISRCGGVDKINEDSMISRSVKYQISLHYNIFKVVKEEFHRRDNHTYKSRGSR